MNELSLFAGAGGGILGGLLLGWRTVCAVEIEPYPRAVLQQRQDDGILPPFPIWDDITIFDGRPWRGIVDIVTGGFPCQDISCAGRGEGITGKRSGLWGEMARVIREVRPRFVLVENSPMLTSRGLGVVLGDLAAMGYDARWGVLGAVDAGAPHKRDRIWIVADAGSVQRRQQASGDVLSNDNGEKGAQRHKTFGGKNWNRFDLVQKSLAVCDTEWVPPSPPDGKLDDVAHQLDRLKAIGNGQVPQVVALAWEILVDTPRGV